MALQDITSLLQRVALDRGTKLQILAVLATNPDPRAAEDIETLLRSYDEMEAKERELLMTKLGAIDAAYREKVRASEAALQRDVVAAQDEIQRNDEIERIRKSLT